MIRLALLVIALVIGPEAMAQTSLAPPKPAKVAKVVSDPAISDATATLARSLKDPVSAKFQNVRARDTVNHRGQPMKVVCGEVNAKNSFGAFIGFAPWIYLVDMKQAFLLGPDRDIVTVDMLKSYCS